MKNKKDYIYQVIKEQNIDICLQQEVEVEKNYDSNLLTDKDYKIEVETNNIKARVAILIRENIQYERLYTLEDLNSGVVMINIFGKTEYRIINIYRSFNPPNNLTPKQFFEKLMNLIRSAINTIGKKSEFLREISIWTTINVMHWITIINFSLSP